MLAETALMKLQTQNSELEKNGLAPVKSQWMKFR